MAVRGVDHQQVDAGLGERAGLGADVAVDADGGGDAQPALVVDGGCVDAGPDRPGAGQHAGQGAVRVGQHRHVDRRVFEQVEHLAWVGARGRGDEIGYRDVADPGEPVDADAAGLGDQPDRAALEHHDGGAVCALVDQRRRVRHRIVGRQHDRGVDDQVAALDEVDRLLDRRDGKVLRQNDNAAAAGHRFGHPAACHRRHVRHHHRDGGARPVVRREVDVEP